MAGGRDSGAGRSGVRRAEPDHPDRRGAAPGDRHRDGPGRPPAAAGGAPAAVRRAGRADRRGVRDRGRLPGRHPAGWGVREPTAAAGVADSVPGCDVRPGRRDRLPAAIRRSGLAGLLRWLRLPGRGYHQIPLRNLLRTPRRSALTLLGVAAAIATLVTIIGLLDTFRATLGGASAELLRAAPARVTVSLDSYYPVTGPAVAAVRRLPEAGRVQPGLMVPGTVRAYGTSVGVAAEVLPPGAIWAPALSAGRLTGGLVLSRKAADDLGVSAGDLVTFRHPRATTGGR